jgi:hypothetical protein
MRQRIGNSQISPDRQYSDITNVVRPLAEAQILFRNFTAANLCKSPFQKSPPQRSQARGSQAKSQRKSIIYSILQAAKISPKITLRNDFSLLRNRLARVSTIFSTSSGMPRHEATAPKNGHISLTYAGFTGVTRK